MRPNVIILLALILALCRCESKSQMPITKTIDDLYDSRIIAVTETVRQAKPVFTVTNFVMTVPRCPDGEIYQDGECRKVLDELSPKE